MLHTQSSSSNKEQQIIYMPPLQEQQVRSYPTVVTSSYAFCRSAQGYMSAVRCTLQPCTGGTSATHSNT